MRKIINISGLAFLLGPQLASAATGESLGSLLNKFTEDLINPAVGILMTLAVVAFFWGLVKYIYSAGSGKDEGKMIMVWGVVALFVMVSIWGLVAVISNTIFGSGGQPGAAPKVNDVLPVTSQNNGGADGSRAIDAINNGYDPLTDNGND